VNRYNKVILHLGFNSKDKNNENTTIIRCEAGMAYNHAEAGFTCFYLDRL